MAEQATNQRTSCVDLAMGRNAPAGRRAKNSRKDKPKEELKKNKAKEKKQAVKMLDLFQDCVVAPDLTLDDVFSNSELLNDIHDFRTNHDKSSYVVSVVPYTVYDKIHFLTLFTKETMIPAKTVLSKHILTIDSVINLADTAKAVKRGEEVSQGCLLFSNLFIYATPPHIRTHTCCYLLSLSLALIIPLLFNLICVSSFRFSQSLNWCVPLVPSATVKATATAPQKVLYRSTRLAGDTEMTDSSETKMAIIKGWLFARLAFDSAHDEGSDTENPNCHIIATLVDAGWELKLVAVKNIPPFTRLLIP